ncbi:MAG: crossover junction endodeoxyribonuclease RuvC [Acidobacteriota bacterium]
MIIAGFDPGSSIFGVGIIKKEEGKISLLFSEEIKFPKVEFNLKMKILIDNIKSVLNKFPVTEAAIEDGFLGKNVKSMNILSKVRGVVLATLLLKGIDLAFYSPGEIKSSLTGNGNAGKEQVNKMVKILLNSGEKNFGFDESDALATAICHSMRLNSIKKGLYK